MDALATGVGNHWIEGYGSLGSVPAVVGTAVVGISIMEMVMHQNDGPACTERTRAMDDGGILGNSIPDSHHADQMGPGMGKGPGKGCVTNHRGKSWRSEPSRRRGRDSFYQLVKNLQWEEHRTGSATPAVQQGSVPRKLFFAAQQRIAIT